jgi:hypothetical protein
MLGAVIAKAEVQVVALALIYALLDRATVIGLAHLESALAVWLAHASASHIFGDSLGDDVGDTILAALLGARGNCSGSFHGESIDYVEVAE